MTNMDTITEMLERARVADGKVLTDDRLREVFDMVKPVGNWKEPIACIIAKPYATKAEIEVAVAWFAGGLPDIEDLGTKWRVSGAGYYEWIGS
jgi:hypothetical protein